jgi:hypothetical protein
MAMPPEKRVRFSGIICQKIKVIIVLKILYIIVK